jgi:hypothetical protein
MGCLDGGRVGSESARHHHFRVAEPDLCGTAGFAPRYARARSASPVDLRRTGRDRRTAALNWLEPAPAAWPTILDGGSEVATMPSLAPTRVAPPLADDETAARGVGASRLRSALKEADAVPGARGWETSDAAPLAGTPLAPGWTSAPCAAAEPTPCPT